MARNFCGFEFLPYFQRSAKISSRKKICRKHFSCKKITPVYTYCNLNSLHKNTVLRNSVWSITTCLFHSETKRYTTNYWFYTRYPLPVVLFENMYRISSNSSRGRLLFFSNKKREIIRGKAIIRGRRLF